MSYMFEYVMNEYRAQSSLAARGAEIFKQIIFHKIAVQRERENRVLEKLKENVERIRTHQARRFKHEPENQYEAFRSGDYYMFEDECDEPTTSSSTAAAAAAAAATPATSRDHDQGDEQHVTTTTTTTMTGTTPLMTTVFDECDVDDDEALLRGSISSRMSKRSRLAAASKHAKKASDAFSAAAAAAMAATASISSETRSLNDLELLSSTESRQRQHVAASKIDENEPTTSTTMDTSVEHQPPQDDLNTAQDQPKSPQQQQQQVKSSWLTIENKTMLKTRDVVRKYSVLLMDTVIEYFNHYSKDFRLVSHILTNEKLLLKKGYSDVGVGPLSLTTSVASAASAGAGAGSLQASVSATSNNIIAIVATTSTSERGVNEASSGLLRAAECKTSASDPKFVLLEKYDHKSIMAATRDLDAGMNAQSRFNKLFISVTYFFLSQTEILCYFFMVLNHLSSGSALSIPLPIR